MSRSQAWSQSMPFLLAKSWTVFLSSSTLALTMTSGWPAFFWRRSLSSGRALRQGTHQVAQKSSSTTLPLRLSRLTVLPSRVWREKGGAGSPASAKAAMAGTSRQTPSAKTIPVRRRLSALHDIPISSRRDSTRRRRLAGAGLQAARPGESLPDAVAAAAGAVAAAGAQAGAAAPGVALLARAAARGGEAGGGPAD